MDLNSIAAAEAFQDDGTTLLLVKVLEILLGRRGHSYLYPLFSTPAIHTVFSWLVPVTQPSEAQLVNDTTQLHSRPGQSLSSL